MSIINRLKKNYKHLSKWAKHNHIDAYRLYDKDIPEYPFSIDIYGENCIIYYYQDQIDEEKSFQWPETKEGLLELGFTNSNLYLKTRKKQKGNQQYEKLNQKRKISIINEQQAKFKVNLSDYLDSGLFLDHRPLRQLIHKKAQDKSFLNLFCYTGAVSVFAAIGGAKEVTSVDMSKQYLEWAQDNFNLNGLESKKYSFLCENVLDFLIEDDRKFDLIFLDPPTFSNSKKMDHDFEVERDQRKLIHQTMEKLNSDGELYFSTNKTQFKIDKNLDIDFSIKDITSSSIPQDFRNKKIHKLFKITHLI